MPNIDLGQLFLLFIIVTSVLPMLQRYWVETTRIRAIRAFEKQRGSRLITLIHRQESLSFLGLNFARFIDIEDSEQILRAIRLTSADTPIDMILHTPGGLVLAAEQIAHALIRHKAPVTVFVPHYAMSGGTMLALAADKIVMDPNAVLGPTDPQLGQTPAASILTVLEQKKPEDIDDQTLIMADVARKAIVQVHDTLYRILTANGMEPDKAAHLANLFSTGKWTHDCPLSVEELQEMGLPVSTDIPDEVLELMELYPQATQRRPSVQYIPLPYGREDRPAPQSPRPASPAAPVRRR